MSEEYKTYAYFWISGFDVPIQDISKKLGLEPTDAWNKGDPSKYLLQRKQSTWRYYSPLPRTEMFLDAHIKALINILAERREIIKELKKQYEAGISCVGYYKCANPGFHLDEDIIKDMASLNLSVDFDLYCLGESDKKDI